MVTVLVQFLPQSWQNDVNKWMPALAGQPGLGGEVQPGGPSMFSAWPGFAVLAGYAVVALIGGSSCSAAATRSPA